MQIVPSTLIAAIVVLALLMRGPWRGVWIMMVVTPLGAAAAFNLPALGGATIGLTDIATLTAFAIVCLTPGGFERLVGTMRPYQPGFWLILLAGWCAVSAILAPRLFMGETEVFAISRSANETGIVRLPLRPSTGNITQLFRLMLGVLAFLALATVFRRRPDSAPIFKAIIITTVLHCALGWLDVLTFATGTSALMEPIRTANYAILDNVRMVGLKRMIGGFPEASSFGAYTLGLWGFWLHYWLVRPGSKAVPWMLALTTVALLRSTSSSAYVAGITFVLIYGGIMLFGRFRARAARRSVSVAVATVIALWLGALAIFTAYQLVEPVTAYMDRALFDKLETASGVERFSWNAQAMQNFADTWGIGAGLGSVRASSWLMACLGSIGLFGTMLYLMFLGTLAAAPARSSDDARDAVIGALKSACLALLMVALLTKSTPDLDVLFFMLAGLIAGLSRGGLMADRNRHEDHDTAQS